MYVQCMQTSSDVDLEQNIDHDTTEVRRRIKSFSREPEARPSSCYGESKRQELSRAGSISAASPPSIIKVQEVSHRCRIIISLDVDVFATIVHVCNNNNMYRSLQCQLSPAVIFSQTAALYGVQQVAHVQLLKIKTR